MVPVQGEARATSNEFGSDGQSIEIGLVREGDFGYYQARYLATQGGWNKKGSVVDGEAG